MLETRQGDKYIKAFHDAHPDTFMVASSPISMGDAWEQVDWVIENINDDALASSSHHGIMWYCVDEIDATAIKLRWG